MAEKKTRSAKVEGGRKVIAVRLHDELARCIALYAANHGKSAGQTLAEVTEAWWQKVPDRAKYEKLQETK